MVMADEVLMLEKCASCGVDVRDGTSFCYNCGKSVVAEDLETGENVPSENRDIVDEVPDDVEKLAEADRSARRASAAMERKRSRVGTKRQTKVVWVAPTPSADRLYLLLCILLFVVAVAVVAITTFIR